LGSLVAFALTALIIEITPGPNMTYLAALSLSNGVRVGFAAVAGITLGLMTYGVIAALGLAALMTVLHCSTACRDGAAWPICYGLAGKAGRVARNGAGHDRRQWRPAVACLPARADYQSA
jgi:hypothetical protein